MSAPAPRGAAPVPPHARTSSRRTAWPLAIAAGLALAGASGDALGDDTLEEWTAEAAAAVGPEDRTPILMVDADGFAGASVRALALSDDGRFLAAADDAVVRIYDLRTNQPHRTIRGYREATGSNVGRVNTLAFAPGGDYLALGVTDNSPLGSTRLIDVRDGSVRLVEGHTGCTLTVRFSPDGRHFATSGCDGHAYLYRWQQRGSWNAEGGRVTQLLDLTSESGGTRGADFAGVGWEPRFSADGQFLIDPSTSKGVWAVTPRRLVKDVNELPDGLADLLRTPPTRSAPGYEATITETPCYAGALPVRRSQFAAPFVAQAWQRDEAPDSERYRLMIWDARGGRPKHELPMTYLAAAATLNAAANLAAAADARGTIRVWELTDGKVEGTQIARFDPAGRPLWNVTWSPDGTALRVAADHYERGRFHYNRFGGVTHEFDLRALLFRPSAAAAPDRPITAALPAGRVTTRQREGVSYNPGYGLALLAPRPGGGTNSVWLDPWQDEDREATVTNLNLALPEQYGRPMCYAAAAYPGSTGTHLFFGTDTGRLYEGRLVYDRTNRPLFRPVRRFLGHDGTVTALAISPDRRRLASSSLDGTVRVWGLTPPRELGDLDAATRGTEVTNVPLASLAYKAGLREDDRLVRFGETSFYGRFGSLVAGERRAGDVVEVGLRDGRVGPVTLAPAPDYAFPLWSVYLTRPAAGGSSDATAGDWVAWTADGHYAASEGGAKRVGWHVNDGRAKPARFYTVDQFGDRLHDRRVILAALRNEAPAAAGLPADGPAAPGRVDADDYDAFRKVLPPTISGLAVTPIPSDGPGAAEVTFAVRRPYNAALTAVQVWVDGRLTPGRPAEVGAGREDGAPQTRYRHVVDVPADARLVRVTVEDRRGLRDGADLLLRADDDAADAGEWVTVAAHEEPADPAAAPSFAGAGGDGAGGGGRSFGQNLHLLAIGVSDYEDDRFDLQFADRDAVQFAAFWEEQRGVSFDRVVCETLVDGQATRAGIERGLSDLTRRADADDLAIVFLSGHGVVDDLGTWHFATAACDRDHLDTTGLPEDRFEYFFRRVRAGRLLVISDTCHAGQYAAGQPGRTGLTGRGGPVGPALRAPLWDGEGRVTIASCQPEENSFERADWGGGHGAFTAAALEFLRGGGAHDDNGNGWLNLSEMQTHVSERVRILTADRQHPGFAIPTHVGNPRLLPVAP